MQRGKNSIFSPLMVAILDFSGKWKSVNISKTVRDKSDFERIFDPQGFTRISYAKGKFSIFATFGSHLGF